ncbi:CBS domain-containing protein (plasmid) [Pontibacillus sp. ALD_SL1]|uniref:CBS domain-containing protein n=1 Tax=Pontibacillus sp. ALD_SL1 TaxID=2777185 RepID=UPI001A956411|nr:CBS domain-containing protein [Pontibacillus sp. ALD_SL1]QST03104.1 CBS domain-containing protein [Pontibacillus sp. ALD_SL1]
MIVKNNYVLKDDVVSVRETTSLQKALGIIETSNYRCIPILDKKGKKYVGMLFHKHIETYLSNSYRQGKEPDMGVECAFLAAEKKAIVEEESSFQKALSTVKRLPFVAVVDEKGCFAGILTHNKVFEILEQSLGLHSGNLLYTLACPETIGSLYELTKILKKLNINIEGMTTLDDGSRFVRRVMFAVMTLDKTRKETLKRKLDEKGFRIIHIESI